MWPAQDLYRDSKNLDGDSMTWILSEITRAIGAEASAMLDTRMSFTSVTIDSRVIARESLFVALRGDRFDGHEFVAEALAKGASVAIVEHAVSDVTPEKMLIVGDSLRALGDLAAWTRRRATMQVVAVTGSNGKTTTKEMIAGVLKGADFVSTTGDILKTEGNLNNLVGLPLTLLRMRGDEAVGVLEMGMNQPGEIGRLTEIARPDYGLITNVGRAHLQGLGSLEGVAEAKGELVSGLSNSATIAINVDDEWVKRISAPFVGRKVTYGTNADVRADHIVDFGADGIGFELCIEGRRARLRLPLVGAHNVSNALAAAAITHAMGMPVEAIAAGLCKRIEVAMRMEIVRLGNGVTVINDAYNANPTSTDAALQALQRLPGRSVAVLGDMWELGAESGRAHREVGGRAAALGVARLVVIGEHAAEIRAGAESRGLASDAIDTCDTHEAAASCIVRTWRPGDVILVKGSRGARMEEIVARLEGAGKSP